MAKVPTNPKMFRMFVIQAKARYRTFPSPGASAWVHDQYVKHGGKFMDSGEEKDRRMKLARYKEVAEKRRAKSNKDKHEEKKDKD